MEVKDQLQRSINIKNSPQRIISLVPSQTELLVDLGLKERLVGITKFCVHPSDLRKEITIVGGTKNIQIAKIKALQPDLIICNKEENTKEIVTTLAEFVPVWVSDIYKIDDVFDMITRLGKLLDVAEQASNINESIAAAYHDFIGFMKDKTPKKVAYLIWKNPYMAAGSNTFIDTMLQLNKFENIVGMQANRYPEVILKDLEQPALVLLSSEPYPFKEVDVLEIKNMLQKEVRLVDGEYFSWYGSRLKYAFTYFKSLHT